MRRLGHAPQILVLQHEPGEGLGTLAQILLDGGADLRQVQVHRGEPVPQQIGDATGLVVLGGGMSAHEPDRHPHLRDELELIESALRGGRPILGICLGSQLLAQALGAQVARASAPEIGWHEVTLHPEARADPLWARSPDRFIAFHWHSDAHPLPSGGVRVASSEGCAVQAFRHGLSFGIQFHPEVDEPILRAMAESGREELEGLGLRPEALLAPMRQHLAGLQAVARDAFGGWARIALADAGD